METKKQKTAKTTAKATAKANSSDVEKKAKKQKRLTPKQQLIKDFSSSMRAYEKSILSELLENHNISTAQFKQIVINELKRSEKMQEAFLHNPSSLFASILLCAELGLNPSNEVGEFYFIPFNKKIKPILGYKGVVNLLLRSGDISKLWCEIVYNDDEFEYELGLEPRLRHIPSHNNSKQMKYVYAVAKLTNGESIFKVMSKSEILEIADMTDYRNELYFDLKKDPQGWMYKKTVLKQLSKLLPKDYYGKRGVSVDNKAESGAYLKLDDENNIMVVEAKNKPIKRSKSVYSNLDAETIDVDAEILTLQKDEN